MSRQRKGVFKPPHPRQKWATAAHKYQPVVCHQPEPCSSLGGRPCQEGAEREEQRMTMNHRAGAEKGSPSRQVSPESSGSWEVLSPP